MCFSRVNESGQLELLAAFAFSFAAQTIYLSFSKGMDDRGGDDVVCFSPWLVVVMEVWWVWGVFLPMFLP